MSVRESDPAGYVAGKGDAHDYIPEWMEVPSLKETEGQDDPLAVVKLFTPDSDFTWFIVEYEPETQRAYGLVARHDPALTEFGYFSIAEIAEVTGPMGLAPERDKWFRPRPVTELGAYRKKWEARGPYPGPQRGEQPSDDKNRWIERLRQLAAQQSEKGRVIISREGKDGKGELEALAVRAAEIRARKGKPCTVVVDAEEGEITQVVTPAWLYRQWHLYQTYIHEAIPDDEGRRAVYDAAARGLFLGGENADFGAEFRRFCRCVIQAILLGLDRAAWEEKFEDDGDPAFSPSWVDWMPYIGRADEENPYLDWDVDQLGEELVRLDEEIGRVNVTYGFEPGNMAPGNDAAREYYSLPPERHAAVDLLMMQSDLVVEAKQTKERLNSGQGPESEDESTPELAGEPRQLSLELEV